MEAIDQERKRTINDIKNQVRFVSNRWTFSSYFFIDFRYFRCKARVETISCVSFKRK